MLVIQTKCTYNLIQQSFQILLNLPKSEQTVDKNNE